MHRLALPQVPPVLQPGTCFGSGVPWPVLEWPVTTLGSLPSYLLDRDLKEDKGSVCKVAALSPDPKAKGLKALKSSGLGFGGLGSKKAWTQASVLDCLGSYWNI